MGGFETTELWSTFHERATAAQEATVRGLLDDATALLSRTSDTFPTYTLHTALHAENVVRLMGSLLGERREQLSALESALLLLAAYWHDTGMVFTAEERTRLADEVEFADFLKQHPQAFLAVEANGGALTTDVAEWYCRWRHADRVYYQLDALDPVRLAWHSLSLRDVLGAVCRSHGHPIAQLHDAPFQTDFGAACDVRFCAILLRLADILDFDRSRSPDALIRYLGLDSDEAPRLAASSREWAKHHCSDGFAFPPQRRDGGPYVIDFVAGPTDPAIEYDLRQFLDVIEEELRQCRSMLQSCSSPWADFLLPERINRGTIQSQGYRYGEHRFTLERDDVLSLFMGESLYESPFTFVRELLQNAVDASRHREFFERSAGREGFTAAPVRVSEWIDRDSYRWVCFEDEGIGMSEAIVNDHFLKVGSSYYRSAAFRADVVRYARDGKGFLPISRFGIGLLSCFVLGDRVEVSTRRVTTGEHAEQPIRLSLTSLEGFYTLQAPPLAGRPMPSAHGPAAGYRTRPGTTIAVRIDPRKESEASDLRELVESIVLCAPVAVEFDDDRVDDGDGRLVEEPWCEPLVLRFGHEQVQEVERVLDALLPDGLVLHVLPLDLTAASPHPLLRGQLVSAFVAGGADLEAALVQRQEDSRTIKAIVSGTKVVVTVARRFHSQGRVPRFQNREATFTFVLPAEASPLAAPGSLRISHNGIRVPNQIRTRRGGPFAGVRLMSLDDMITTEGAAVCWYGVLALADGFRPEVSVSRDELRSLPWSVHSAANLALRRAIRRTDVRLMSAPTSSVLSVAPFDRLALLGDIVDDELLTDPGGWREEPLVATAEGQLSITEVCALVAGGNRVSTGQQVPSTIGGPGRSFMTLCRAALLDLNLSLSLNPNAPWSERLVVEAVGNPRLGPGLLLFPPLFFVPYPATLTSALKVGQYYVNADHPFASWLLGTAEALSKRFPGILASLRTTLLTFGQYGFTTQQAQLAQLTATLERLRTLDPDLAPTRLPTLADFPTPTVPHV